MENQFSIIAMIQRSYYATYPLIIMSMICLTFIFERYWALWGIQAKAAKLADSLIPNLRLGKFDEAMQATQNRSNPAERVYHSLIAASQTLDRDTLADLDEERRFQESVELQRYIWVLATSGASAPFIGLFGTVVGILGSFQSMAIMGTGGFSVVAAGISEALIATALGLAVGIVAVIFYNYFSVKIERIDALLQINGWRVIDAALQGRQAVGR